MFKRILHNTIIFFLHAMYGSLIIQLNDKLYLEKNTRISPLLYETLKSKMGCVRTELSTPIITEDSDKDHN